jgi:hypothetical protein
LTPRGDGDLAGVRHAHTDQTARPTKLPKHKDHKDHEDNLAPHGSNSEKIERARKNPLPAHFAHCAGVKHLQFFVSFVFRSLPLSAAKGGLCVEAVCSLFSRS